MKQENTCPRVGITGGIGSGKSTVCRIFAAMGVPVYDADYWAKWLIVHDETIRQGIIELFGPEAYAAGGEYNRGHVAGIAFKEPEKLQALNALVHPAVGRHSQAWHEEQAAKGAPYTLKEAALLIESGGHVGLDYVIFVRASESVRIQRIVARDGLSEAEIMKRIASQMADAEKVVYADFIVENEGQQALIPQVLAIHRQILSRSF